jgi:hypothetical protein
VRYIERSASDPSLRHTVAGTGAVVLYDDAAPAAWWPYGNLDAPAFITADDVARLRAAQEAA